MLSFLRPIHLGVRVRFHVRSLCCPSLKISINFKAEEMSLRIGEIPRGRQHLLELSAETLINLGVWACRSPKIRICR